MCTDLHCDVARLEALYINKSIIIIIIIIIVIITSIGC